MSEDIDHEYTYEIVCPYCGYKFSDCFEFSDEADVECEECKKDFVMERHVDVTYVTAKMEE